jgi:two-component system sensor histidine kinase DesK
MPLEASDGGQLGPVAAGPEELRKRRISGLHRWYAGALVGLIFLVVSMVQVATSGGSLGSIVAFEVLAVCFGAVYLFAPVRVAGGTAFTGAAGGAAGKAGTLGLMLAITVPMIMLGGVGVTALWIYVGVVAAIMFRLPVALGLSVVLACAMLLVWGLAGEGLPWELALTLVALSLWMAGFAGNIRLTVELRATREELARAAVAAERARIGRDLHDILGHSLTAIAVKAGLARRLAERDASAASSQIAPQIVSEIADIERLAREALADVRSTAAGIRDVSLAAELAVARSVLAAAGIQAELPTAVDDVSPAGRDVFGYVVREAVTNVVRHSGARRCVIELSPTSVEVSDDGSGGRSADESGTGLRGLAERLAAVGGTLSVGPRHGGGFRVRADLDGAAAGEAG